MTTKDRPLEHTAIVVFVKNPEPGKVKTRIAVSIGDVEAMLAYKAMAEFIISELAGLEHVFIYASPADAVESIARWLSEHSGSPREFYAQSGASLGERILNAAEATLNRGVAKVIVIGTDCIDISESVLSSAAAELDHCDLVLGPARDGGYYLIGMKSVHPGMLDGIKWSSTSTLRQSVEAAERAGLMVNVLDQILEDADTIDEWEQIKGRLP